MKLINLTNTLLKPALLVAGVLALTLALSPVRVDAAPETGAEAVAEQTAAGAGEHGDAHGAAGAHGEESLFDPPGGVQIVTSLVTLLIFLGLVAVLAKYAWGPIVAGLEKRESRIREDIEAAERARAEAQRAQAEYQQQLATAEQRVRDLMAQAQADGQQLANRIKMTAQEEAEEIKERAMREIEASRREAVEQVRAEAATLATAVAEKILRREVNRDDQKRLIEESLSEFQTVGNA